jgi:hypothetical protein
MNPARAGAIGTLGCFSSSRLCGQQLNSTVWHTAVLLAKTIG